MSISVNKSNGNPEIIMISGKEVAEFQEMLYIIWCSADIKSESPDYRNYIEMLNLLLDGRKDD